MNDVVVDTSAWVDFLAGHELPRLEEALATGSAVLTPIVVAELVSGARIRREQEAIRDLVGQLPMHATPLGHWVGVGELRRRLAAAGLNVSTPDAHVAHCAIERSALLLTRDGVFTRIAALVALRLAPG